MMAKFLMCVRKKLHNPTKDRMVLTSVGGLASLIAFNLFFSRLDTFWRKCEAQVRDFFVAEKTFIEVDFEVMGVQSL